MDPYEPNELKIIQEHSDTVKPVSNNEMTDEQNINNADNANEINTIVSQSANAIVNNLNVNPNNLIEQAPSNHSNEGLQEAHSERTDEISNMITNMMGEIQMYRNSIRNIVNNNTHLNPNNNNQVGVNPQLNLGNNGLNLNGLIQTIPDDNELAGLNQNAVDVLTHLNNQAQAISAGDANAINNINSAGDGQILQGGDVLLQPETVNLLSANLLEQGGIPNLNIEVNPPSNTITDETYPM